VISHNRGTASGPARFARGGGIWNEVLFFEPPVELALELHRRGHNVLAGSPGITVQGGGLFTAFPVALAQARSQGTRPTCARGATWS
jgi:hypothetical protein